MKKKIGPLPVWGWAAAIALGVVVYWFRHSSSGAVAAGNTSVAPTSDVIDPTQGQLDMPAGLSSGGTSPDTVGYDPNAIADAVSAQLIPALSTLPFASTPGDPQNPSTGADGVQQTLDILKAFEATGLVSTLPAASTGAATSQAQKHTTGKATKDRTLHKNSKTGKTFRVQTNPHGKPNGTYHVYGTGKSSRFVKVR